MSFLRALSLPLMTVVGIACWTNAHAQCPSDALWQFSVPITQVATDTKTGPGMSYFGLGSTVYAVWNETGTFPPPSHTAGTKRWSFNLSSGATINNFPVPVPLTGGGGTTQAIFFSGDDGFVYKVHVNGTPMGSVDTRRASCAYDQLLATPAVQLYDLSPPPFQNHVLSIRGFPDDVIYVVTRNQCGDDTQNRIIAYWASDLTVKWIFNATGVKSVGYGSDAVAVDYGSNRIYCGTHQTASGQHTLWAINAMDGTLAWSQDAGSIANRPTFSGGRLYVASVDGMVQKRDINFGALVWSQPVPGPIVRYMWPEYHQIPFSSRIYFTDGNGLLHGIEDLGASAGELRPPISPGGGVAFSTMPVVAPDLDRIFVGRNDGHLQMLSKTGGATEAIVPVGAAGAVFDPSLDVSDPSAATMDRLMVPTAGGLVKRYCVPFASAVAVPQSPTDPVTMDLGQSAPNPFHDETRIEYALPFSGRIELVVYDVQGHRVRALAGGEQRAGPHAVSWDGRDDAGRTVESGVYLYRLKAWGPAGRVLEHSRKIQLFR